MDESPSADGSTPGVRTAPVPALIRLVVAVEQDGRGDGLLPSLERSGRIEVVAAAGDGPELLRVLEAVEHDAIFLGLGGGNGDGADILATLSRDRRTRRLVVRSARADAADATRALALGASAFVARSAPSSEIVTAVEAAVSGGTYIGSSVATTLVAHGPRPAPVDAPPGRPMSRRQRELITALAAGLRNKEIAHRMGLSEETVKGYLKELYARVGVRGRAAIVAWAARQGLID